jgi:hypothetical protein
MQSGERQLILITPAEVLTVGGVLPFGLLFIVSGDTEP